MSADTLSLGTVAGVPVTVPVAAVELARHHAAQIAAALGLSETESSMHAYWDLAHRLRLWGALIERVGLEQLRQMRVLEIGSGMGLFALAGRLLGVDVVGLEPSQQQYDASLAVARLLFGGHPAELTLIQAAGEQLPLPDGRFDLVVSFQTFEHVGHLPAVLREIARVLRPDGLLFAQLPNYAAWYECHYGVFAPLAAGKGLTRAYLRLLGRPTGFLEHLQWVSPPLLLRQLADAGFVATQVRPAGGRPLPLPPGAAALPLPFTPQRGRRAQRAATLLARLTQRLARSDGFYPQIELWAGKQNSSL
ncbi:MAG TPA: methyltransferase domain-containing protein [Roseiflexaceae bacterium]|nr:methyltransferase domain-containing protein [Roseiflexaceae bacterium]